MTLRELFKEELDTDTIQNNISILQKIKGNLTDKTQQQEIDAVISGLEAEQKNKNISSVKKTAQFSKTGQTAQPTNTMQTAQVGT